VDAGALRAAGAFGVMISGRVVQVVIGPRVDTIATDLADLM
jgi:PTS system N-acetylglucosamine-specific IIB component